jgi:hypothetical protein
MDLKALKTEWNDLYFCGVDHLNKISWFVPLQAEKQSKTCKFSMMPELQPGPSPPTPGPPPKQLKIAAICHDHFPSHSKSAKDLSSCLDACHPT